MERVPGKYSLKENKGNVPRWASTLDHAGKELECGGRNCGQQNNGPQRCPCPNPQNLWICYLTWQKDFTGVIKLKILRW